MSNDDYDSHIRRKITMKSLPPYLDEYNQRDAMRVIVELRRKHSNYLSSPVVSVLVPICENCASYHGFSGVPDIVADGWQIDLVALRLSVDEISRIEEMTKDDPSKFVYCRGFCRRELYYGRDNFYVTNMAIEEYAHELLPSADAAKSRKVHKWMKRLIFEVYDKKCFACGLKLEADDNSIDHIFPFSEGGLSELMNLQPLCKKHNELKRNTVPTEEEFTLHFGLIPISDSFDGVVP